MVKNKAVRYTTLKGLLSKTHQFSLSTYLNKRMYHNLKGWCNLKLSDKLDQEIRLKFNSYLGMEINYDKENIGLFQRLIISPKGGVEYIAGQDYPSELRYLKKLLR